MTDAVLDFMSKAGFDAEYGRKLVHELEDVGLEDVAPTAACASTRAASPGTAFAG